MSSDYNKNSSHSGRIDTLIRFFPYVIIIIGALAVWIGPFFFRRGFVLVGDTPFPLTAASSFHDLATRFSLWNGNGTGYVNTYLGDTLYYLFVLMMSKLGLPLEVISRLVFIFPSLILGISTFYLASTVLSRRYSGICCVLASLFAMFSPAQIFQNPILSFSFAGVPLLIGLFIKGLTSIGSNMRYAALVALASVLVLMTPIGGVLALVILIPYFCLHVLLTRKLSMHHVKFILFSVSISLLLNAYSVFPLLYLYLHFNVLSFIYSGANQLGGLGIVRTYADASGLLYVSRLILRPNTQPAFDYYSVSPLIFVMSFLLLVYVYIAIIRRKATVLIFAFIATILTIFATGLHYSFLATIYEWLWNNIPPFAVLNTPTYFQMGLTVAYSVLIAETTQLLIIKSADSVFLKQLSSRFRFPSVWKWIVVIFALMLIVSNGGMTLNLINNNHFTINQGKALPPLKVPSSYYELEDYLSSSPYTSRLLVVPFQSYIEYSWYHTNGTMLLADGILPSFSPLPIIGINPSLDPLEKYLVGNLTDGSVSTALRFMEYLDIQFVLVSKDLAGNTFASNFPQFGSNSIHYLQILNNNSNIFSPVLDTPEFTLYKLSNEYIDSNVFLSNLNLTDSRSNIFLSNSTSTLITRTYSIPIFDGNSTFIQVNQTKPFDTSSGNSAFAWIFPEEIQSSGQIAVNPTIIDFGSNLAYRLYVDGATHKLSLAWFNGTALSCNYVIPSFQWTFVGFTYDGSNVSLIVNGHTVFTQNNTIAVPPGNATFYIGHDGTTSFFDGAISNVQVYKSVIPSNQVQSLYNSGIAGKPVSNSSLEGWWPLNDKTSIGANLSNNMNNGILEGKLTWDNIAIASNFPSITPVNFSVNSPNEYKLNVHISNKTYLILSQTYDRNWIAYANGTKITSHFPFMGTTNAWYVNKTGNLNIELVYMPQFHLYPFYAVSTVGTLGCLTFVLFPKQHLRSMLSRLIQTFRTFALSRNSG